MTTFDAALREFEATAANLAKLDSLWERIENLQPSGPAFGAPPEYQVLCLAFRRILPSLPAIDGLRVEDRLHEYDEAGQMHLDALELGEVEVQVSVMNSLEEQGRQLREYRFRLEAKRRELVRDRLVELIHDVEKLLSGLSSVIEGRESNESISEDAWEHLKEAFSEIDTLLGATSRPTRWRDLQRHLYFGKVVDLLDIVKHDWPSVSDSIRSELYGQHDPVPVAATDLGEIVAARPVGSVTTKLGWSVLDDEDFERLVFLLISETSGYENPKWLQLTHAPDRGRDLSVDRVESDQLTGVRRYRTIIQCKHWLSKSVGATDIGKARSQMELWQSPRVDDLVIATTGRFTADAIELVEQHNLSDRALHIVMWPDSHLERLLAARPHLIGQFRLRQGV